MIPIYISGGHNTVFHRVAGVVCAHGQHLGGQQSGEQEGATDWSELRKVASTRLQAGRRLFVFAFTFASILGPC